MTGRMAGTSPSIDREKSDTAGRILGTTSMTTTVDAALTEIVNLDRRRRLVERIRRDGGIGPSDAERRRLRTP